MPEPEVPFVVEYFADHPEMRRRIKEAHVPTPSGTCAACRRHPEPTRFENCAFLAWATQAEQVTRQRPRR